MLAMGVTLGSGLLLIPAFPPRGRRSRKRPLDFPCKLVSHSSDSLLDRWRSASWRGLALRWPMIVMNHFAQRNRTMLPAGSEQLRDVVTA